MGHHLLTVTLAGSTPVSCLMCDKVYESTPMELRLRNLPTMVTVQNTRHCSQD